MISVVVKRVLMRMCVFEDKWKAWLMGIKLLSN